MTSTQKKLAEAMAADKDKLLRSLLEKLVALDYILSGANVSVASCETHRAILTGVRSSGMIRDSKIVREVGLLCTGIADTTGLHPLVDPELWETIRYVMDEFGIKSDMKPAKSYTRQEVR